MPSNIEWTDEAWNPSTGCTKVSPGCAHCYAEQMTKRYAGRPGWPETFVPWVPGNDTVVLHPGRLDAPLHWKTPRRVFVDSMSDLFHDDVPFEYVDKVYAVMALAQQHTFQVLTKRPERRLEYFEGAHRFDAVLDAMEAFTGKPIERDLQAVWPRGNVWEGITVENQRFADERIPLLLQTPAAVRFISAEPLLQAIEIGEWMQWTTLNRGGPDIGVDWVIVGGESGPKHRAFDPAWARSIVAQCRDANVACFVKQLGGARPGNKLEDLPEDLRVREYPR